MTEECPNTRFKNLPHCKNQLQKSHAICYHFKDFIEKNNKSVNIKGEIGYVQTMKSQGWKGQLGQGKMGIWVPIL